MDNTIPDYGTNVTPPFSRDPFNLPVLDNNSTLKDQEKERNKCPHCPFTTVWKSSLSVHIRTHTNERPWKCALCNKHFKLKHHLKCHLLTHSNKPTKCNLCNFRCSDSRIMQRHKLLSHKIGFKKRPVSRPTLVMPVSSNSDDTFNSFFGDGSSAVSAIGQSSNPLNTPGYGYKVPAIPLQNEPVPQSEIRASPNRVLWQRNLSSQSFPQQAISSSPSIQHQQRWPIITASSSLQEVQLKEQLRQKSSDLASVSSTDSVIVIKEEVPQLIELDDSSDLNPPCFQFPSGNSDAQQNTSTDESSASELRITSPQSTTTIAEKNEVTPKRLRTVSTHSISNTSTVASDCSTVKRSEPKWRCPHCDIIFPDNIMFGLHMACHSVGHPYKCNICGFICRDRHDFTFHFSMGKHSTENANH